MKTKEPFFADKFILLPAIFGVLWYLNFLLPLGSIGNITFANYSQRIWFLTMILLGIASVYVILKEWSFNLKRLMVGLVLAVAVWNPLSSVITFLTFYGATLIFEKTQNRIKAFEDKPITILYSILLGIGIGIPLSIINIFLALSSNGISINPENPVWALTHALVPGISEEIIFRFFIYALCVYLLGDGAKKGIASRLCLAMMIIPHVLLHHPDIFLTHHLIEGFVSMIILSVSFGLPMALLQLRRNLESAIALHWFIDFIRFWLLGM